MQIRPVTSEDFPMVLAMLEQAFPDVTRSFFHAVSQYDPWYNENFSLAVEVDKKIVAFLQVFDRTMILDGNPIRIGGIGSVGTHPKHTGKGYASILMKHAYELIQKEGMAGGLLFTKIHPFYERLGWQTLHLTEQVVQIIDLPIAPNKAFTSRPFKESDIESLHEIYQNEQKTISGTIQRNSSYWQKRPFWMSHPCRVILKEQKIVGYFYTAKYREHVPMLHVIEYGFLSPDEETVRAWFAELVNTAKEKFCSCLCANVLVHPTVKKIMQDQNIPLIPQPYHYMMWKEANDQNLLNQINRKIQEDLFVYWQTDAF